MHHRSHQQHPGVALLAPLPAALSQPGGARENLGLPNGRCRRCWRGIRKPKVFQGPLQATPRHVPLLAPRQDSPACTPGQLTNAPACTAPLRALPGASSQGGPGPLPAPSLLKDTMHCGSFSWKRSWRAPRSPAPPHGVTSLPRVGNIKAAALLPPLVPCWVCHPGSEVTQASAMGTWPIPSATAGGNGTAALPASSSVSWWEGDEALPGAAQPSRA